MLKLPYISGREIKDWYSAIGIPMPNRIAKEIAIRARRVEKKVLGDIDPCAEHREKRRELAKRKLSEN